MLPVNDGQRSGERKKPKIDEVESEKNQYKEWLIKEISTLLRNGSIREKSE